MSEIAKCPICGKDVKKSIWRPEYEGCAGNVVITVKCCGVEALTVELWNRYAAAMELAKAEVVALEITKQTDSDEEIHEAFNARNEARQRVLEVFNGHNL